MDEKVIAALEEARAAGESAELCLLVETHGSAPRKAGACLALRADGGMAGTVGGGALERLVLKETARCLGAGASAVRAFAMDGARSATGMVCGGDARVCLLHVDPAVAGEGVRALAQAQGGGAAWLAVDLADPEDPAAAVLARDADGALVTRPFTLSAEERAAAAAARAKGSAGVLIAHEGFDAAAITACEKPQLLGRVFVLPVVPEGRVFVIGGGHVGAALVPVLAGLGFAVTVCDSRPDVARPERFPAAERVVCAPFERLGEQVRITPCDYVVVCTPAHGSDVAVLAQALGARARYVGCLGSAKKTAHVKRVLAERGIAAEELARLHMPVGVPLGDETPAEIAVSIAAEIIRERRGYRG